MYFRGLNKRDEVVSVTPTGTSAIKVELESGAFHAMNNVQWSTAKDRDVIIEGVPTVVDSGTVHFSHQGGNSSVISARISVDTPFTFDSVVYTSITTLTTDLLTKMP